MLSKISRGRLLVRVREHHSGVVQHLADALQVVVALHAPQQHVLDAQVDLEHGVVLGQLLVVKTEARVVPVEDAVDRLLGLRLEVAHEVVGGERSHLDQDASEVLVAAVLGGQRDAQLVLGDAAAGEQEVTEPLRRVVRRATDDLAVTQHDPLAHVIALDLERTGSSRPTQPLQQVRQGHRLQRPEQRHATTLVTNLGRETRCGKRVSTSLRGTDAECH